MAVGTMEPHIDIWDVDVVDTLEPVISLGRRKKKKSKKVSRCSSVILINKLMTDKLSNECFLLFRSQEPLRKDTVMQSLIYLGIIL